MRSDGITAHFGGEKLPPEFPPRFGVSVLWFTFEGDNAVYRFNPEGAVNFWEWRLDIFAPDGGHVLLSQDRYGPYHIVATARLKAYLNGRAKPDHVVAKPRQPGAPAGVHSDAHWISPTQVRFTVTCCGESETVTASLGSAADKTDPAPR